MTNVTFLFGAGASRDVLPIVNEFHKSILDFINIFQKPKYKLPEVEDFSETLKTKFPLLKNEIQQEFINNLKWLSNESLNHSSIDTYAKKLYVKNDYENLLRLKATLSAYLIFEQARNPVDKRYDSFFASILGSTANQLPKQLKILSWNYDYQIEKAYINFTNYDEIYYAQETLNIVSKYSRNLSDTNKFGVFKLNGTTGFTNTLMKRHSSIIKNVNEKFEKPLIDTVLQYYAAVTRLANIQPSLSFAWEKDEDRENNIVEKAIAGVKETNILIVVGYSFPFFNREIDRKVLGSMKDLKKVYLQSPDANDLKERFNSIRQDIPDDKIIPRFSVDQFYLPNEL